ncbi:MAG TPA: S9 family peptidase [Thermoanaerobaculia bacterium]|nr:S9 family peptidase [Thermoanaerobaculia bacterium]
MVSVVSLRRVLAPLALLSLAAVPAVADDDVRELVTRLAKVGSCTSPSFSPDAKRLAMICNLSGLPQVWTVPVEGGWPTQVTALDDQVTGIDWSPVDPEVLALSLAPGGGLNEQVYVVRPSGLSLERITEGGKINNRLFGWTPDGKYLLLGSNRANPGSLDSYIYHVGLGRLRLAAVNAGTGSIEDVSDDGRWGLVSRVKSRGDSNLYLIGLHERADVLLTPHEPPGNFDNPRFSPDGRTVYLLSDLDRDRIGLARVRLQARPASREEIEREEREEEEEEEEAEERGAEADAPVTWKVGASEVIAGRDDADLSTFEITEDGKTAALLWNVAGESQLSFLDLATLKETPGPDLPGAIAGGLEFSKDGQLLAMNLSGANLPTDIWVLDRTSGALRQVTFSPHAGILLEALVAPKLVTFKAHDGLELSGWLYRPPGPAAAGPVVISFHGGPEAQERPSFSYTYQALLSRGISVFAPNVRGSAGFGKRFVNLDNGEKRFDGIKDIKACVDFLVGQGIADPKRIGIMGGSYGGYMTMVGLTEYPELFAAGANLFGMINFETFFSHTEPWMAAISTSEYGDPATQKDLLQRLSPIHKVDRIQAPTIVLHGANDTNVPVVEAEQTVESLKKRGIPVEYVLFPDEGHGFRKTPNKVRSAVAIVEWFEKYLKTGTGEAAARK